MEVPSELEQKSPELKQETSEKSVHLKKRKTSLNRNQRAGTKRSSCKESPEVPAKKAKNVSKEVARKTVGNDRRVRKSVLAGKKVKKTPEKVEVSRDKVEVSSGKVEKKGKKSPAQNSSAGKRKVTPKVCLCLLVLEILFE